MPLAPTLIPPLQTPGRCREPHVEAQANGCLVAPFGEVLRRVALTDRAAPQFVCEEALVCLLREWNRRGNMEAVSQVAEVLIKRTARFITQQIHVWHSLSPSQQEDCIRDVQMQMLEDFLSDLRGVEFWEVRFWLCLKRRLLNQVQKYRIAAEHELHLNPSEDDEGHSSDPLTNLPATEHLPTTQTVEIGEALAQLSEQERKAFVLTHYHDWGQQEIAAHLKVTDRTVRNLLQRAEKRLADWRREQMH